MNRWEESHINSGIWMINLTSLLSVTLLLTLAHCQDWFPGQVSRSGFPGLVSRTGFCCTWLLELTFSGCRWWFPDVRRGNLRCGPPLSCDEGLIGDLWCRNHESTDAIGDVFNLKRKDSAKMNLTGSPLFSCFHDKNLCCCFFFFFLTNLLPRKDGLLVWNVYKINLTLAKFAFFHIPAPSKFAVATTPSWLEAIPE